MIESSTSQSPQPSTNLVPLWASALILAALLLVQSARLFERPGMATQSVSPAALFEGRALGDLVSQTGSYSMLTFNGGNEDILAVLDSQSEEMYLYLVRNQQRLEYLGKDSLKTLFADARLLGAGRK